MMEATPQSDALCLVNGQPLNSLSVMDRGLAYGDGLFETIRFSGRCMPAWPYHYKRLLRGCKVLQLALDIQRVEKSVESALDYAQREGMEAGVLKLIVTRGIGGQGYIPPATENCTVAVILRPYKPLALTPDTSAVELKTCGYRLSHNHVLAGLKHLNRLEHVLAAQSVDLEAGQQGLVFDCDGYVIETLHHNLFTVKNGSLFTPDLKRCGVNGVMRSAIVEAFAPSLSIPVQVSALGSSDLRVADEVFICNGVHGITPVCRWHESVWPIGEVTRQLRQNISEQWTGFYGR